MVYSNCLIFVLVCFHTNPNYWLLFPGGRWNCEDLIDALNTSALRQSKIKEDTEGTEGYHYQIIYISYQYLYKYREMVCIQMDTTGRLEMGKWLSFLVHMSRLNGCSTFRSGRLVGQIWSNIRWRLEYSMSHALVRTSKCQRCRLIECQVQSQEAKVHRRKRDLICNASASGIVHSP